MSEGIDSSDWSRSQERIFAADNVISEVLRNPIQRERVDVAVALVGKAGLVLDIGAGDMSISQLIKNNGNTVVGADFGKVIKDSRGKGMNGVAAEATKLPFRDETFDAIIAGEIVEHFLDHRPFMRELRRALKTGGRVILTTPNAVRLRNRLAMLFGDVTPWHEWQKVPHHVRYWTFDTLFAALAEHGLDARRMGTGRSQGEGCFIESIESMEQFFTGQVPKEDLLILQRIIRSTVPQAEMLRSFVIMEAEKVRIEEIRQLATTAVAST